MDAELQDESVELLQAMIRNACVNDGRVESGEEVRNSDLLETYLEGSGLDIQTYDSAPGRRSIVSRIEGSDPNAPTLCLMGHTDVVPVSPDGWSRDPFGGEIVDGEIWGRGAIDMLNLTATQAVVFKHLARSDFKPKGTLLFFGVADEEAGGTWGARWMADNHWDDIAADYVLTEMGGIPMPSNDGPRRITITVGEKGIAWRRLTVKGTPGHGSMPFGADNALIKSAEIVKRLAEYRPASRIDDIWEQTVKAYELPHDITAGLLDPDRIWDTFEKVEPARGKLFHACTHTTFSPNVLHGGVKTNVIPDSVEIDVDIRTVVGTTAEDVDAHLREAIGDELAESVEISALFNDEASISPMGTPMWDSLLKRSQQVYPGAEFVPQLLVGATDSRFYREKGSVAYGTGLYSPDVTWEQWASRFHGHDERIDIASLGLTSDLWLGVIEDMIT